MTKIAYNACYGGFSLSSHALSLGRELSGDPRWGGRYGGRYDVCRHDPILISVIEELGEKVNGDCANIQIEDIPSGTKYRIDEYDGFEEVATIDSYEWVTAP